MTNESESGSQVEWLANTLSNARTDPLTLLQRTSVNEYPEQRYLVLAVRAYVATRVGVQERTAAIAVIESLEEGCPSFSHYVADITTAHQDLSERATLALVSLPASSSDREAMNYVSTLVDQGHGDSAARLFLKTIENTQAEASFFAQWTQKRAQVESDYDSWLDTLEDTRAVLDENVDAARERLTEARKNLELLVDEVSEEAARELAADYAAQSKLDKESARNSVVAAITFLSLSAASAVGFVIADAMTHGSFSTTEVVSHVLVSATLLAIAGYCARLGGEYRRAMWHWKHTQLQLQRFFPFIGRLGDEDQALLITAMTPKFFPGQPDHPIGANQRLDAAESNLSASDALTMKLIDAGLSTRSR